MVVSHRNAKVAALLGFTAVCVFIFLYLYKDAGGELGFSTPYTVNAILPETFNLVPDSDVRAAGVKIGVVNSVVPDGANAKVTFEIDSHTKWFPPIYKNATDQVRTKTLVGETYLSITPGTKAAGEIKTGGTIPLSGNVDAVPLDQVLGMFNAQTRAGVESTMKGLGQGLNGHGAQLNTLFGELDPTVSNGNTLFEILNPERQEVASLIDDTGTVMQALGERTADYQALVQDAKTTAVAVSSRAAQLKTTLADLPSTLAQANDTVSRLNTFSDSATPVFSDLRTASADLSPAIQQLEPTAAEGQVLFRRLKPFLNQLGPLMTQLKPAATDLKTLVLPLDGLLRQADPALAYLAPYSTDLAAWFSDVGATADSPDKLGDRGRVFAIGGSQVFGDLSPSEEDLVNALEKIGSFGILAGARDNPYPQPGTAGDPGSSENFKVVKAAP